MSQQNSDHTARASPSSDARRPRLNGVKNWQGLPSTGRGGLKKLVQIRIATINIGTMTGRSRELADTLKNRKVDIACVQETKWKGAKSKDIGEGFKLTYFGEQSSRNGVGVVVSEKLRDNIVEVCRITDRIMSVKIDTGKVILRVISCYAPQQGCPDEEKLAFWEKLEDHLQSFDPSEHLIIAGDFNGHVGQSRNGFEQCHGGQGFGTRNEEGSRILEFAEAHNLAVTNTYFRKKTSHLVTYYSGGRTTQIDYILVRREDLRLVTNVKVIPSDVIGPQHKPLIMDIRIDLRQHKKKATTSSDRIKWWRLREHKQQMADKLGRIKVCENLSVEELWTELTTEIHKIADETLGRTKPGKTFIDKQVWWWNEEVQEAAKLKKLSYKTWLNSKTDINLQEYRNQKSLVKKLVAKAKTEHYGDIYEKLGTPEGAKSIYRLAKARNKATQDITQVKFIKDENHNTLRDPTEVLNRWQQYFEKISNEEFPHPPIQSAPPVQGPVPNITLAEVEASVQKMKSGKATGPDDIPAEVWKQMGKLGNEALCLLFNKIIISKEIPQVWKTSITVPIWKGKGDVLECSNYRPIRLLCHTMKIFEQIINNRIGHIVTITPNQCGFVRGSSTTDAIHAVRLLVERHREKNKSIHVAFLDLEKAFDRVPHDLIWHSLRSHLVPEEYVEWIKMLYKDATSVVQCPAGRSKPFKVTVGVHQGGNLSPPIFNICMDTATADIQRPHPWTLLYADDVELADEARTGLESRVQQWDTRLAENGLRLNVRKTEYVEFGEQTEGTIHINGIPLQKVPQFKYLGSVFSNDGDTLPDAKARISATWAKWRSVTGVLCDKKMPIWLKSKIYKTVVRPAALYGSECWPTSVKHEQALHSMEMRMLRWSLGLTLFDHTLNTDVRKRFGVAPIGSKMQEARLRWYGHVQRRDDSSVAKNALAIDPPGKRPRGRPKKRWMDQINEDLKAKGATPADALDRAKWRQVSKHADPAPRRE